MPPLALMQMWVYGGVGLTGALNQPYSIMAFFVSLKMILIPPHLAPVACLPHPLPCQIWFHLSPISSCFLFLSLPTICLPFPLPAPVPMLGPNSKREHIISFLSPQRLLDLLSSSKSIINRDKNANLTNYSGVLFLTPLPKLESKAANKSYNITSV